MRLEPVVIEHFRKCEFKAKPCKTCGKPKGSKAHAPKATATCEFKRQNGCLTCSKAKGHPDHVGAPESFNLFAGGGWEAYQNAKQRWHKVLAPLLQEAGLPKNLAGVLVEGECSYGGNPRKRDQGNSRVILEKALGDVLVEEGYIDNDTWDQYEFGNLALREDGTNCIRLMIFPRAKAGEPPVRGEQLPLAEPTVPF